MAIEMGRDPTGIELNPEYVKYSKDAVDAAMLAGGGRVKELSSK